MATANCLRCGMENSSSPINPVDEVCQREMTRDDGYWSWMKERDKARSAAKGKV